MRTGIRDRGLRLLFSYNDNWIRVRDLVMVIGGGIGNGLEIWNCMWRLKFRIEDCGYGFGIWKGELGSRIGKGGVLRIGHHLGIWFRN